MEGIPKYVTIINGIDRNNMRYDTHGDYWIDPCCDDYLHVRICKSEDDVEDFSVLIHELVEVFLVLRAGIDLNDVDSFDINYEVAREHGCKVADCGCYFYDEPGEDPHAPYYHQHEIAEEIAEFVRDRMKRYLNKDVILKK